MKLNLIQVNYLSFLILLVGIIFISACVPQNSEQNVNSAEAKISDKSTDNGVVPVVDNTAKPTAVTIDNGSCIIKEAYGIPGTMCQIGARYAKYYSITVSGSMTGPKDTSFTFEDTPGIPTLGKETFSCGGWETDDLMHHCTRRANSSIETAQWSLTRNEVMGEYVNVNPNMQVIINAEVRDDFYGKVMDNATYTISCPTIDYCSLRR